MLDTVSAASEHRTVLVRDGFVEVIGAHSNRDPIMRVTNIGIFQIPLPDETVVIVSRMGKSGQMR
jgi:hypothetical protein